MMGSVLGGGERRVAGALLPAHAAVTARSGLLDAAHDGVPLSAAAVSPTAGGAETAATPAAGEGGRAGGAGGVPRSRLVLSTFNLLAPCYKRCTGKEQPCATSSSSALFSAMHATTTTADDATAPQHVVTTPTAGDKSIMAAARAFAGVPGGNDAGNQGSATATGAAGGGAGVGGGCGGGGRRRREASDERLWRCRLARTFGFLLENGMGGSGSYGGGGGSRDVSGSDVLFFQEFWFEPPFMDAFGAWAEENDFSVHTMKRTAHKTDGVAILLRRDRFRVQGNHRMKLCPIGNRVALLLHLKDLHAGGTDLLLVNTHLTFPHTEFDRQNQIRQIRNLNRGVDEYIEKTQDLTAAVPVVVAGDFNVISTDPVCTYLTERSYANCYEALYQDTRPCVTHFNHEGAAVHVDQIFCRQGLVQLTPGGTGPGTETGTANDTVGDGYGDAESKDEGRVESGTLGAAMTLSKVSVLPANMTSDVWHEEMGEVSDHRPVQVCFHLAHKPSLAAPTEQQLAMLQEDHEETQGDGVVRPARPETESADMSPSTPTP